MGAPCGAPVWTRVVHQQPAAHRKPLCPACGKEKEYHDKHKHLDAGVSEVLCSEARVRLCLVSRSISFIGKRFHAFGSAMTIESRIRK